MTQRAVLRDAGAGEDGGEPFDARKTTVVEDRLYFAEGRLFRWALARVAVAVVAVLAVAAA